MEREADLVGPCCLMVSRLLQRYRTPLTALGGALLGVAIMLLVLQLDPPAGRYDDADIQRLADERIEKITPAPPVEPEIYAMLRPSVVQITWQPAGPPAGQATRTGPGVVVDLNGAILTAYHVVAGTETVTVQFFDGTTAPGTVAQTLPERDLAVVRVRGLPSSGPRAGRRPGGPCPSRGGSAPWPWFGCAACRAAPSRRRYRAACGRATRCSPSAPPSARRGARAGGS